MTTGMQAGFDLSRMIYFQEQILDFREAPFMEIADWQSAFSMALPVMPADHPN